MIGSDIAVDVRLSGKQRRNRSVISIDAAVGENDDADSIFERSVGFFAEAIERYRMAMRAPGRPKQADQGAKRRGEGMPEKVLSVTVSIGVARPSAEQSPREVVKAADEALYRAKRAGKNRVVIDAATDLYAVAEPELPEPVPVASLHA